MQCEGPNCKFHTERTKEHLLHHIKSGIPTTISHTDLDIIPTRNDFLDPKLKAAFKAQISANKPILFMPNTHIEKPEWVNGSSTYNIYLFGILPCGTKTCVILTNIDIYLDVAVPSGISCVEFDQILRGMMLVDNHKFLRIVDTKMYKLHGFQTTRAPFKRIFFDNNTDRKKVITLLHKENQKLRDARDANPKIVQRYERIETASDDMELFNKVAREARFNTADWNRFEKYEISPPCKNCEYVFRVNVADFKALSNAQRQDLVKPSNPLNKVIDRDPMLIASWDIETHRTIQNGQVPTPLDKDFTIFMICTLFAHHHSDTPIFDICCVDVATNAREGMTLVIECGVERNVLIAHMNIVGGMAPDILEAFNGSNFDWPLVREKCSREGLLVQLKDKFSSLPLTTRGNYVDNNDNVKQWSFRKESIKISAELNHDLACVANFPGMLDIDVLPTFLRLYSRAEIRKSASLNYFLAENKLESKEDMPYKRMFRIYERAIKLTNIKSCHCGSAQLECATCKEFVRELDYKPNDDTASMEFLEYSNELYDDIKDKCCCCGKKPRNYRDMGDVGYYCVIDCLRPQQLMVKRTVVPDKRELSTMSFVSLYDSFYRADGMKVCNLTGADCFKRGVAFSNAHSGKLATEKDHYPGAYVLEPDRGLHSDGMLDLERVIDGLVQTIHKLGRPITGLDFSSLYPSLIRAYNLSPDMIIKTLEEANKLAAQGYSLHRIHPFDYEQGAKKSEAANKHLSANGWTVRHNGVFADDDTHIVTHYNKFEKYTYKQDGKEHSVKIPAEINGKVDRESPAFAQVQSLRDAGVKLSRKVIYEDVRGREALPGERVGIFGYILDKLFNMRVPIKAEFVKLGNIKEIMDKQKVDEIDIDGVHYTRKDVEFRIAKVDSKQKAIKVLANTFYGKSGDYNASIYSLLVAAGITCAGQENIKKVKSFVESKGFVAHYGDTDSLYLSCPDSVFIECDAKHEKELAAMELLFEGVPKEPIDGCDTARVEEYRKARLEVRLRWWTEMVEITMKVMNDLKEQVSDFLLSDNGTLFLNMAYEEVGYPAVFCGKKKYFMTAHMETINFYPDEIFVKGIEVVKQGQAGITKQLGEEFMREVLSPENEKDMFTLAQEKIRKFYNMSHDYKSFAVKGRYKPDKKNVPMHVFNDRMIIAQKMHSNDPMLQALYEPPEPGDKFDYVICKKDLKFTLQGKRLEIKKGDQMEYTRVYLASQQSANPMQIDLDYYMKNAIVGIFARFIAYHHLFQPPRGKFDTSDKEGYKEMDKYCVKEASKYLEGICNKIIGYDSAQITQCGRNYQKIFRRADKQICTKLGMRLGSAGFVVRSFAIRSEESAQTSISTRIITQMKEMATELALDCASMGKRFLAKNAEGANLSLFALRRLYVTREHTRSSPDLSIMRLRVAWCNNREEEIVNNLYANMNKLSSIIHNYECNVGLIINDMRSVKYDDDIQIEDDDLEKLNDFSESDQATILTVHALMISLFAVYRMRASVMSIANAINKACATAIDEVIEPTTSKRQMAIEDTVRVRPMPGYDWQ